MRDYRERTIVAKNRPRKSGARSGLTGLVSGVAVVCFLLGITVGALVFRTPRAASQAKGTEAGTPTAQVGAGTPANVATPAPTSPPLTFYDTLEKGGRVPLGTGLNPVVKEAPAELPAAAAKPVPPPPSSPLAPQSVTPGSAPVSQPALAAAPAKPAAGVLTVQVSAHQNRQEAETARGNLSAKGFDAYLVPVQVAGKGTMYRVRVGRHLDPVKAKELAVRIGNGALVTPE